MCFFFLGMFDRYLWINPENHNDQEYADTEHPNDSDFPCDRCIFFHQSIRNGIPDAFTSPKPPYDKEYKGYKYDEEGRGGHRSALWRRQNTTAKQRIEGISSIGNSRKNQERILYLLLFIIYCMLCNILLFHWHLVVAELVVSHILVSYDDSKNFRKFL